MAKIDLSQLQPDSFPFEGQPVYLRDTKSGPVVQSRPTVGRTWTPTRRWWANQFTIAARMAASPQPLEYLTAVHLTKGTEQVPRDLLMMAAFGRAYSIEFPDGTVSTVADHGPPPPNPEVEGAQMLGWSQFNTLWGNTTSSVYYGTAGVIIEPTAFMRLSAVHFLHAWTAAKKYRLQVSTTEETNKVLTVLHQVEYEATLTDTRVVRFPVELDLDVGQTYAFTMTDVRSSGSGDFRPKSQGSPSWDLPVIQRSAVTSADLTLPPGTVLSMTPGGRHVPFGLEVRF